MTSQAEILATLRSLLDTPPLPAREQDPVGYIAAASTRAESEGTELSVADKDLAYQLFVAGFNFPPDAD